MHTLSIFVEHGIIIREIIRNAVDYQSILLAAEKKSHNKYRWYYIVRVMFENLSQLQPMSKKLENILRRSLIYRKNLNMITF